MKIDGWDIRNAKARQARYINNHHSLSNGSVWNAGSNRPIFQKNQMGFKSFTLELWVKGDGYQEIVNNRGIILSKLMQEVTLEPDWTEHKFQAVLNKFSITETSKQRFHVLSLEFNGYEYMDTVTFTNEVSAKFVVENAGTAPTPVTLEIIPKGGAIGIPEDQMIASIICDTDGVYISDETDGAVVAGYDYDTLIITGLSRDPRTEEALEIKVKNYTPGKKIIIDGETGLITEEGQTKIDDVEIWELPDLKPGENIITTNNNWLEVTIKYNPRFM